MQDGINGKPNQSPFHTIDKNLKSERQKPKGLKNWLCLGLVENFEGSFHTIYKDLKSECQKPERILKLRLYLGLVENFAGSDGRSLTYK